MASPLANGLPTILKRTGKKQPSRRSLPESRIALWSQECGGPPSTLGPEKTPVSVEGVRRSWACRSWRLVLRGLCLVERLSRTRKRGRPNEIIAGIESREALASSRGRNSRAQENSRGWLRLFRYKFDAWNGQQRCFAVYQLRGILPKRLLTGRLHCKYTACQARTLFPVIVQAEVAF